MINVNGQNYIFKIVESWRNDNSSNSKILTDEELNESLTDSFFSMSIERKCSYCNILLTTSRNNAVTLSCCKLPFFSVSSKIEYCLFF